MDLIESKNGTKWLILKRLMRFHPALCTSQILCYMDKTGPPDGENIKKRILTRSLLFPTHYGTFKNIISLRNTFMSLFFNTYIQHIYYKLIEKF